MKGTQYLLLVLLVLITSVICCDDETAEENASIINTNTSMYSVTLDSLRADTRYHYPYIGAGQVVAMTIGNEREVQRELEEGRIPSELRQALERQLQLWGQMLAADATLSGGRPTWTITSGNERYRLKEERGEHDRPVLGVYEVTGVSFYLEITVGNRSSNELLMDSVSFSIEDRDENVVHHEYQPESVTLPVKVLAGGKTVGHLDFHVPIEPKGEYKLAVAFGSEVIIMELPEYEFDKDGKFTWTAP